MENEKDVVAYEKAGLFARLYFTWVTPLILKANHQKIEINDLWPPRTLETSAAAEADLLACWNDEIQLAAMQKREPNFRRAIAKMIRWNIAISFSFCMGALGAGIFSNSFLLQCVLQFLQSPTEPMWYGVLLAFAFLVSEACRSIGTNQHWVISVLAGLRVRTAVRAMIYDKALQVRDASIDPGRTVTLLTNDAQRISDAVNNFDMLLATPPILLTTLAVTWAKVGPAAFAGFLVMLVGLPLQARIAAWTGSIRRRAVKITDERARLMAEALAGIKLIKYFGWERAFAGRLAEIRGREVGELAAAMRARVANTALASSIPVLVTLATFSAHAALSPEPLTASQVASAALTFCREPRTRSKNHARLRARRRKNPQVFVTVALFNIARYPLTILPAATRNLSEALVACSRIQAFLSAPEIDPGDLPAREGAPPAAP